MGEWSPAAILLVSVAAWIALTHVIIPGVQIWRESRKPTISASVAAGVWVFTLLDGGVREWTFPMGLAIGAVLVELYRSNG
jgi:hypothetical protein